MDRTKEFVPAGQNPPYSDVLLVSRTVQQFLQRSEQGIVEREKPIATDSAAAHKRRAFVQEWGQRRVLRDERGLEIGVGSQRPLLDHNRASVTTNFCQGP